MRRTPILRQESLSRKVEIGILVAVFVLAVGLRVAYLRASGVWDAPPENDGIEYDKLAANLLEGQGFALDEGQPYGFRPPGFPAFVALIYAIFGRSCLAVRLVNAVLGGFTCVLVYFFTKRVWRWQTGVIASLGTAAHPLLIYLTGIIYPECLILLLVAVVFLLTSHARETRRIGEVVPLGVVSAYLVFLRPSLLLLGLAQTVWAWVTYKTVRRRLLASAVLVLILVVSVIPWSVRNYLVFDEFVWMSTNGGVTLWASNNPLAEGGWTEPSRRTWLEPEPPRDLRGWPGLTETESEARFQAAGMRWIREHPADLLRLLPRKLVRAWSLAFGNEARTMDLPAVMRAAYALYLLVCLAGFVLSLRRWRDALTLYLPIVVLTGATLVFYGSTRQSSIMAPSLLIFAALACDRAILALQEMRVRMASARDRGELSPGRLPGEDS
jgi:4-amino-4-deoxy-L-arabinose transferase-like glycosyltransferase